MACAAVLRGTPCIIVLPWYVPPPTVDCAWRVALANLEPLLASGTFGCAVAYTCELFLCFLLFGYWLLLGWTTHLATVSTFTFGHSYLLFFAVFADLRHAAAVGAPLLPGLRIRSPEPARIRSRLLWVFLYSPGFFAITNSYTTNSAE